METQEDHMKRIGFLALSAVLGLLGVQASSAGGSCDQPYYPVRSGATWTYRTELSTSKTTQHTITLENVTDKSFTQHQVFGADTKSTVDIRLNWVCDEKGLTSSLSKNNTVSSSTTQVNATVIKQSGVVVPANLGAGSSWTFSQTSAMKMGGQDLQIPSEATFKAAGEERVTVPAGSFTALKIMGVTKITMAGSSKPNIMNTTIWYARGVGMVKTITDAGTKTELLSYKI
jgi:hypothetical protein